MQKNRSKQIFQWAARVRIGSIWSELEGEAEKWINDTVDTAGELIFALENRAKENNETGLRNMVNAVIDLTSVHEECVEGMLSIARQSNLSSSCLESLTQRIGMNSLDVIDNFLIALGVSSPNHIHLGLALTHERLIRYGDIGPGKRYLEKARAVGHPGGWLTPYLHQLETDHGTCLSFGGPLRTPQIKPTLKAAILVHKTFKEVLEKRQLAPVRRPAPKACIAAHEDMMLHSNGEIYTQVFEINGNASQTWEDVLGPNVRCHEIPAWRAAQTFFGAALHGGAYSTRKSAWQSRMLMGQAFAGFTRAHQKTSFDEVLDIASQASWYRLEADSDWFAQIAWDDSLLGCDTNQATLIAVTDTD